MKKEKWALGLSIVAMTIAIIATCIAAYRTPELGFDYQGVIVGILSLLVTVLIGWNIYTFIDIKGTSQKLISLELNLKENKEVEFRNTI